jgi:tyrosine-protein kinase Etk/Wzc
MRRVAESLQLNVQYFLVKSPINFEQYPNTSIKVNFLTGNNSIYGLDTTFIVSILSKNTFTLSDTKGRYSVTKTFGEQISTKFGKIVITPNSFKVGEVITVVITPIDLIADNYSSSIRIEPKSKTASIISLSLDDVSVEKANAIINKLINQQNEEAIADKNEVSRNTLDFINDRTNLITAELSAVENNVETFKTQNKLVDVVSEGGLFLETGTDNQKAILEVNTQIRLADFMIDYLSKHSEPSELIPSNIGFSESSIDNLTETYNTLVLERNKILKSSSSKNPIIVNLDAQIASLNNNVKVSLNNFKATLLIKEKELQKQDQAINSKIASVPKYEREYRNIQRQQQIKEALYLYLLQKREETAIALAVTVANTKIIDTAYSNGKPISPKKRIFYLFGLLLGVILPATLIYLLELIDNKIHNKKDIDKYNLPYLGDIPLSEVKDRLVVSRSDNSSISEAFRHLRTNISFMMGGDTKNKNKTIFVTSTISKEGKSFVALNLAATIAISGKKVVLIGMDLRAPKILEYLDVQNKSNIGLSNYIVDTDIELKDIIIPISGRENFYILPSGMIPPNPAELLMNQRISEMFDYVKNNFDYVIVDTAPVSMVTDTFLISCYADSFIYVARANYLDKRMLHIAEHLYHEKRLSNMAILVNGTESQKGNGLGYGYGYGYGQEKQKTFFSKLFSK